MKLKVGEATKCIGVGFSLFVFEKKHGSIIMLWVGEGTTKEMQILYGSTL